MAIPFFNMRRRATPWVRPLTPPLAISLAQTFNRRPGRVDGRAAVRSDQLFRLVVYRRSPRRRRRHACQRRPPGGRLPGACLEPPMTAVSPENAAYQLIPLLDLPFAYGGDAAAFRQAAQPTQSGGRVNAYYDHLYPLYPARQVSAAQGQEPAEPLIGGHALRFNGQLAPADIAHNAAASGHPGLDFAPEEPRQATTAVLAAADGVITEAGIDESGSYFVTIVHVAPAVGSFQTSYWHLEPDAHFNDSQAQVGQPIGGGDRIGTMGGNGWGGGRQLHFEVRFDQDQNGRFT
ncbi:MAG: M23 family metallopeptidase [Chloroflexi bacterium]|nr:M23 family metallopeptidase [Chloroflexota bacterium]